MQVAGLLPALHAVSQLPLMICELEAQQMYDPCVGVPSWLQAVHLAPQVASTQDGWQVALAPLPHT